MLDLVVVAGDQVTEVMELGVGRLNDPAAGVALETASVLVTVDTRREVRNDQLNTTTLQVFLRGTRLLWRALPPRVATRLDWKAKGALREEYPGRRPVR